MKKTNFFLKGVLAALVLTLVLAGCDNGAQDVVLPNIGDPEVTSKQVQGGILLTWNPVIEASGYEVWRTGSDKLAKKLSSVSQTDDGVFFCFDLVSSTNNLKAGTEYTYTVIARTTSAVKDLGKWEDKVTTGTFPAEGSRAAEPKDVSYTIDTEKREITITVTPPDSGIIPNGYWIAVVSANQNSSWTGSSSEYKQQISAEPVKVTLDLPSAYGTGIYYRIIAEPQIGSDLYKAGEEVRTEVEYEPLVTGSLSAYQSSYVYTNSVSSGVVAGISLNNLENIKSDVTYTIERAEVNTTTNIAGAYSAVTLSKSSSAAEAVTLSVDVLGNYTVGSSVYDRSLPLSEKTYKYRLKAAKGSSVEYITANNTVVDFTSYISISFSVGAASPAGTYAVTPSVNANTKALLTASSVSEVKVYFLIGAEYDSYETGGYTAANSITFSKAELTAATLAAKPLVIPAKSAASTGPNQYAWVQARLIKDGEPVGSGLSFSTYTGGINGSDYSYLPDYTQQTHYKLVY